MLSSAQRDWQHTKYKGRLFKLMLKERGKCYAKTEFKQFLLKFRKEQNKMFYTLDWT